MGKGQAPVPITGYRWARFALPILRLKPNSIALEPVFWVNMQASLDKMATQLD